MAAVFAAGQVKYGENNKTGTLGVGNQEWGNEYSLIV
jgi:hypothetical protein